jgi:soluble lytic murein transglycosylase
VRISQADQVLLNGDWEGAKNEYQTALQNSSEPEVDNAATLGLGRVAYLEGDFKQTRRLLEGLIVEAGDSPLLADAYFLLGEALMDLEKYSEAAQAFDRYLGLRPGLIESYVQDLRGDALSAVGDYPAAIQAYQASSQAPHLNDDLAIEVKLAHTYELAGDLPTAIVAYQDIYQRTSNDYIKAHLDLLLGQAFNSQGETEKANQAYLDAVNNFPKAYDAYLALLDLVEADVAVDELQRGLVDYYAGQYAVAIEAFDRYLQAEPSDPGTAVYFKGLAERALGEYQAAMKSWDQVIIDFPESDHWGEALLEKANTQWFDLSKYQPASKTLIDAVNADPLHPLAAQFLFEAARIAERGERLDQAAKLWERVANEYPDSELSNQAVFLAGITRYRLADYLVAQDLFQRLQAQANDPGERAKAYLWIGKSQAIQRKTQDAQVSWQQAAELDPTGYYSERAHDLMENRQPFTPPEEYDLSFDLNSERIEAEAWMRTVFDIPEEVDLSNLGPLSSDPNLIRGTEFWRLGLEREARLEFESLRQAIESDPANNYRLANYLLELGLYRPAIFAARQVLTLAGMDDASTLNAPIFFNHVRFGPYYRDLIISASQTFDLHPLFLFSVVRQESLFESFAGSTAGARGLMQIIPSTGQEIAKSLNWEGELSPSDLDRPQVSIELGSQYLNRQRGFMPGDLYATLAAYNGGPGNALTWKNLVPPDQDLLLEVIRFDETQDYIRRIYENFAIYSQIYNRTP